MAIEVFNRYETKYMLDQTDYEELSCRITKYMEPDLFSTDGGYYSICNIYYDTETDALIRKSNDKPVYKEKLRLRAYGTPSLGDKAFVEIKKKYNGIVNKRRTTMTLAEAYDYLNKDVRPCGAGINAQVLSEIDYFKKHYKIVPKLYLSYDRRAYFGKDDRDLRITFDTNITTRRSNLRLEAGAYGQKILEPGKWLMEIKISGAAPLWLTTILSEMNIYPASFSKYGTEYKMYVKESIRKGEKITCLNQYSQQLTQQFQLAHQF